MADKSATELAQNRFVWVPTDIRLVRKAKANVKNSKTEGTKSLPMPEMHKKQLEIEVKNLGNQG